MSENIKQNIFLFFFRSFISFFGSLSLDEQAWTMWKFCRKSHEKCTRRTATDVYDHLWTKKWAPCGTNLFKRMDAMNKLATRNTTINSRYFWFMNSIVLPVATFWLHWCNLLCIACSFFPETFKFLWKSFQLFVHTTHSIYMRRRDKKNKHD